MATRIKERKMVAEKSIEAPAEPIVLGIVPKGELHEVRLDAIIDPPGTPDRMARPDDEAQIRETARSLAEVGQLQPVMVEDLGGGKYARVFGRRRIAAARHNKWEKILAVVVQPLKAEARRTIVAVENIQRKNLTAAEEHLAVAELLELQALHAAKQIGAKLAWVKAGEPLNDETIAEAAKDPKAFKTLSHGALADANVRGRACQIVAAMLAKSPEWVRDRMYVGRLDEKARALVLAEKLPLMHAREIAKVADPTIRADLATRYAIGGSDTNNDFEAGDFEELRREVQQRIFSLQVVPWNLNTRVGEMPACDTCPHNSLNNPGLFDHGGGASTEIRSGVGYGGFSGTLTETQAAAGVCTMHTCYAAKVTATKGAIAAAAKKIVDDGKKLADMLKPFMSQKALEAKVRHRREKAKSRTHSGGASGRGARQSESDWEAKYEAERKHVEAMMAWREPARTALVTLLKKNRLVLVAMSMLDDYTTVMNKPSPRLKALLARIVAITPETAPAMFLEIAREATQCDTNMYIRNDDVWAMVGDAVGAKLDEKRPQLKDFMAQKAKPEPKAATPAPKTKPAKGRKAVPA